MLKAVAALALIAVSSPAYALGWFHRSAPAPAEKSAARTTAIDGHDLFHRGPLNRSPMRDFTSMNNLLSPLNPLSPMSPINLGNQMNQLPRMGRF